MDNISIEERVQRKLKQLKALQSSGTKKPLTDDELLDKAKQSVEKKYPAADQKVDQVDIESLFIDKAEKKLGLDLLKKYLHDYTIESISDRNTVAQLIYLEILNYRLQKVLNDTQKDTKGAIPDRLVTLIHSNIREITALKTTLGIAKGKKEESRDGYAYFQLLKKRAKVWLKENQASRTILCPHCGKMNMLKIKTDVWEAQKHPFFRDRILGNEKLISLYKENKISKQDLAEVFEVSPFYIDWLVDKGWGLKIEPPKEEKKDNENNAAQATI